jgi:hypothetical protein
MKLFLTPACLLIGLSLTFMPTIASAQSSLFGGNSGDNRDPFSRASTGDTSGLMQLINQSQLNGKTNPNFGKEQQEQLNSATEDFRIRQLKALRDRQATPSTAVKTK